MLFRSLYKTKNLFSKKNFSEVILFKANGILSESIYNINKTTATGNKKFYKITLFFSLQEKYSSIRSFIDKLRMFFTKHTMLYNKKAYSKAIKLTIYGIGKKRISMKNCFVNLVKREIKHDCFTRLSVFLNFNDCMSNAYKKIKKDENYYYYSNYENI